jgi:hypothetical protein
MEDAQGSDASAKAGEADTSYDLSRIIRASAAASLVGRLFAILGGVSLALGIYGGYEVVANRDTFGPPAFIVSLLLTSLFMILVCFAFSIALWAVSEGLMILRDIEENTRPRGMEGL